MISKILKIAAVAAFAVASSASAESWTLDGDSSQLTFGSVKKDTVGESHSFSGLSGNVTGDGTVSLDIDLTSVETNIDIRNERMNEHVFKGAATASLNGEIDLDDVKDLAVGESTITYIEGSLSFLGTALDIDVEMFVVRVSETQVMASTNELIWIAVEDAGITAGIDKLMELAKLPGITRAFPVTARLMFNLDEQKAEAAPAAPTLTLENIQFTAAHAEGDAKKGKRVFRKCKACHDVKEAKNGVGPSLYNIVGAEAGKVDGFGSYSSEMTSSGLVWDEETLAAFLAKPKDVVPGSNMSFSGLKKESEIADLIAYLKAP